MTGYQCKICRNIYWPNECQASRTEQEEVEHFCPFCDKWTPEHLVAISDPAFDGNKQ